MFHIILCRIYCVNLQTLMTYVLLYSWLTACTCLWNTFYQISVNIAAWAVILIIRWACNIIFVETYTHCIPTRVILKNNPRYTFLHFDLQIYNSTEHMIKQLCLTFVMALVYWQLPLVANSNTCIQLKTGQGGKWLLQSHLWCPNDLARLWIE